MTLVHSLPVSIHPLAHTLLSRASSVVAHLVVSLSLSLSPSHRARRASTSLDTDARALSIRSHRAAKPAGADGTRRRSFARAVRALAMTETNERLVVKPALETVRAFDGPLDLDLGTLLASDGAALDVTAADGARAEEEARERARDVLQRLVAELFSLPSENDAHGRFAQLPEPSTVFRDFARCPPSRRR